MRNQWLFVVGLGKRFVLTFVALYFLVKCINPMAELSSSTALPKLYPGSSLTNMTMIGNMGFLGTCSTCTHTLPADAGNVDGLKLKLKPGDVICLQGGVKYGPLRFINLKGTKENPITIMSCGGKALVEAVDRDYSVKVLHSRNFRITGGETEYGILLRGGQLGLSLDYLTTNFEIDHLEVVQVGFAGIMAKTDPTCDDSTTREYFIMRDISIHDNFIHTTGGEGIYVGNSFYGDGVKQSCGVRMPHSIQGINIYNNLVEFTGWDGIQLGSAVNGAAVYNNDIKSFGTAGKAMQNSGIQIGEGTGGLCFNNLIKDGSGNGITMLGLGDNLVSGNVIIGTGGAGIFCDDRYTKGTTFRFVDNIIINPKQQGIRLYSVNVKSVVKNNLIINPPIFPKDPAVPLSTDYVYKRNTMVKVDESNNTYTRNIADVSDVYEAAFRYSAITQLSTGAVLGAVTPNPHPMKIRDLIQGKKVPIIFD